MEFNPIVFKMNSYLNERLRNALNVVRTELKKLCPEGT